MDLTFNEVDALNVALNWFGGSMNKLDAFVASIDGSIMRDLVDANLLRKKFFGWEITRSGRDELDERDITHFSDTRS